MTLTIYISQYHLRGALPPTSVTVIACGHHGKLFTLPSVYSPCEAAGFDRVHAKIQP